MPDVVAVTGATGFIGRHILGLLADMGAITRALTRQNRTSTDKLQWVNGDLADKTALNQLVQDADVVIHCAGLVRGNSYHVFDEVNVTGTDNLVQAIEGQGIKAKFIFISSLAAREPQLSWYAKSKFQAERVITMSDVSFNWSILRPTAVYGPGDKELSPLFRATKSGMLPITGSPESKFGLIYIDDLVQAIKLCMSSESTDGKIYELDDGTPGGYDRFKLKQIAGQVWGNNVRIISVPVSLINGIAKINLFLSRYFNYLPMLTPGKVRELSHHDWVCNNHHFSEDTGWHPNTVLKDGLEKAILSNRP